MQKTFSQNFGLTRFLANFHTKKFATNPVSLKFACNFATKFKFTRNFGRNFSTDFEFTGNFPAKFKIYTKNLPAIFFVNSFYLFYKQGVSKTF